MSRFASFSLLLSTLPAAWVLTWAIQRVSGWLANTGPVRRINAWAAVTYDRESVKL